MRLLEGLLASHQFLMPAEYGFGSEDQDGLSWLLTRTIGPLFELIGTDRKRPFF